MLLLLVTSLFALQSCQSEYSERMSKAVKLKEQYQRVQDNMVTQNPDLQIQLSKIENEIRFHAALSGNESLFLEEIWNN